MHFVFVSHPTALSSVAENTALLGDLVLKLPDVAHALLAQQPEWKLLARWGVGFMNDSGVYKKREATLLHLVILAAKIFKRLLSC